MVKMKDFIEATLERGNVTRGIEFFELAGEMISRFPEFEACVVFLIPEEFDNLRNKVELSVNKEITLDKMGSMDWGLLVLKIKDKSFICIRRENIEGNRALLLMYDDVEEFEERVGNPAKSVVMQ